MRVTTLGALMVDDQPVRGQRLATVVRVLLEAQGRVVPASSLVEAVWDGDAPRDAAGAVQALVSRVRRLGLPVSNVAGGYAMPTAQLQVDAVQAAALADRARASLRDGDPDSASRHAGAARALLPSAPDIHDPTARALLHDIAIVAAQAALVTHSRAPEVEADLRLLTGTVPPDEAAAALLVRLLAADGRDAEALQFVETLRRGLSDRYGADLAPALAEVHVALLRGELAAPGGPQAPVVEPRATSVLPTGWRRSPTALVGRDADVAAIVATLAEPVLLTVVGPGGTGKTRLAAEVARRAVRSSSPGLAPVRVVELAGVRAPQEVAGVIAAVLGSNDGSALVRGTEPPTAELTGLLVVDNCEHVLDAAARALAPVLATNPSLSVLATSRAPLGLPGEVVYRLRALADDDALALLTDRARAGGATLSSIRDRALALCHRLDNLPLALELAAARLRDMPIEDVLAGLEDRSTGRRGLLDDALRGLPERHASLWSMVDWSHALLAPPVQDLWRALAVIPAPFTAGLAQAVAPHLSVREGLATLVEQSLLSLGPGEDGVPRYRMLETVREYGETRLDAAGERAAAMAGLVAWAAARAVALAEDFLGPAQATALAHCAADQDSLAVALRWSIETGDEPSSVDIARALFQLWTVQGRHREVVTWSVPLLRPDDPAGRRVSTIVNGATAGAALPDADRLAWLLLLVGINAGITGLAIRIAAICRHAMRRLFAERGALISHRAAALAWVPVTTDVTEPEKALVTVARMLADPDPLVQGLGLFLRSAVWENQGRDTEALSDGLACYHRFEAVGDDWVLGLAAQLIASRLAASGLPGAGHWLARAARHLRTVGATEDVRSLQVQLDTQLAAAGDEQAAGRLVEAAADADPFASAIARVGLAEIAIRAGRSGEAMAHIEAVARSTDTAPWPSPQAAVLTFAATAVLRLWARQASPDGRPAADTTVPFAAAQLDRVRELALSTGDVPTLGAWALAGAELAAHRHEDELARQLWALAARLGARVVYPVQEGHGARLAEALEVAPGRESLVEAWRERPASVAIERIRELMAELLASRS